MLKHPATDGKLVANARFMANTPTGVRLVGREMLRALLEEFEAVGRTIRVATPEGAEPAQRAFVEASPAGIIDRGYTGHIGEQILMPMRYPAETIVSFCNTTPLLARRSIVWLHDSQVFDYPLTYPRAYRILHWVLFNGMRARRFEIVTVSHASRQRLIELGIDAERISVIYNGGDHLLRAPVDHSALHAANLRERPFIFMVGSKARHKNIPFAAEALLQRLPANMQIAIAGLGQEGPFGGARAMEADPRVVRLPRLDDGQLRAFYQAAACVVTPSLAEGFGLSVAEAMWEGAPQALSDRGALPEVGGAAALYFDPTDAEQMASQVRACLVPECAARLRAEATVQREKFSWRRSARVLIERYLDERALPANG